MLRRTTPRRTAVAAAELAFVLPLLLLIVLICIDFGRFAYTYIGVHNAARAGASYGIMNPVVVSNTTAFNAWKTKIRDAARDEMTGQTGYDSTKLAVDVPTPVTNATTGERTITVVASYDSFKTIVAWPGIPSSVVLKKTIKMRAIR